VSARQPRPRIRLSWKANVGEVLRLIERLTTSGSNEEHESGEAPIAILPFFFVNENSLTYAYLPNATEAGFSNKMNKQVIA
jgi:hypothetical protein